jgi:hypothetical protein
VLDILVPLVADEDNEYHQPLVFLNVTLVKLLQTPKAQTPMLVTLLPIVTLVKLLQL